MTQPTFTPPSDETLANRFGFHPATEDTGPRHDAVRRLALQFSKDLRDLTPCCPEQSLAINAVDLAMMLANAAIARHTKKPEGQERKPRCEVCKDTGFTPDGMECYRCGVILGNG
jgi:hypothetical protein